MVKHMSTSRARQQKLVFYLLDQNLLSAKIAKSAFTSPQKIKAVENVHTIQRKIISPQNPFSFSMKICATQTYHGVPNFPINK